MKITTEPLEGRRLSLTIEVDAGRSKRIKRQLARKVSREVNIPGFRKGRAPFSVLVQRFGADVLRQEIADKLGEEIYREAIEQEGITPASPGELVETRLDPLTFTFTVSLLPEVDLGDYRDYRLEYSRPEVSEEALHHALEDIRRENAILAPVERPAEWGDVIMVDIEAQTSEGDVFLSQEEVRFFLDVERGEPVPGLFDAVVGMTEDERRTFTLTLPEDISQEELQGEAATFTIESSAVYDRILPELDDDLARTVGNFDSLEELQEHMRQQMLETGWAKAEEDYASQVMEDVIDGAEVSYSPDLLENALDDAVENYGEIVARQEHLMLEDYLRIEGKTMEQLREELRPGVARNLERSLVLREVVKQEGLEVSEEEIEVQIERSSEEWGDRAEEVRTALRTAEGRQDLRQRMLANKALQRLVAIAKGEAPELPSVEDAVEAVEDAVETSEEPEA